MADLTAIFGLLLLIGVAYPGMLCAGWLLFPGLVGRAQARLERSPWRCFWSGAGIAAAAAIPILILLGMAFGPAKFLGWSLLAVLLLFSSLGAAGLAGRLGSELNRRSAGSLSPAAGFVRGAMVLELASVFPLLGWFLVIPLTTLAALGASALALLHREPAPVPGEAAGPRHEQAALPQS